MPAQVDQYSYGAPRGDGEGLRIGCTRYLPRYVKASTYARDGIMDVWLPVLAPSRELLAWARAADLDDAKNAAAFARRYEAEMKKTDPRQVIRTLALLASRAPISVGCFCKSGTCHRFTLQKLIKAAADGKF